MAEREMERKGEERGMERKREQLQLLSKEREKKQEGGLLIINSVESNPERQRKIY